MEAQDNVFIAGMMKSGGIHISNSLCQMLGWRRSSLCSQQQTGFLEQDINPYVAGTLLPQKQFLFHSHTRAWPSNTDMLKNFGIRPVVLIRNVPDVIVSAMDQLNKEEQRTLNPKLLPGIWVPKTFDRLTGKEQEVFLAQNLGPWLLSFYVSWKTQTDVKCLWVKYEDHFTNQVESFWRMLSWVGQPVRCSTEGVAEIAKQKHFNFNVGAIGRGQALCEEAVRVLGSQVDAWGPGWASLIRQDLFSPTDDFVARRTSSRAKQDSPTWNPSPAKWPSVADSTLSITITNGEPS